MSRAVAADGAGALSPDVSDLNDELTSLYRRAANLRAKSVFDPSNMVLAEHIELARLTHELRDVHGVVFP